MDKDTYAEMFDLGMRGVLARMFIVSGGAPAEDALRKIRGELPITLRDLASISNATGCSLEIRFSHPKDPEVTP